MRKETRNKTKQVQNFSQRVNPRTKLENPVSRTDFCALHLDKCTLVGQFNGPQQLRTGRYWCFIERPLWSIEGSSREHLCLTKAAFFLSSRTPNLEKVDSLPIIVIFNQSWSLSHPVSFFVYVHLIALNLARVVNAITWDSWQTLMLMTLMTKTAQTNLLHLIAPSILDNAALM